MIKIFFATDFHGSTMCFKKFLRAKEFYGSDMLVMGGDVSGKRIVFIQEKNNKNFIIYGGKTKIDISSQKELKTYMDSCERSGVYCAIIDGPIESIDLQMQKSLYREAVCERLMNWLDLAKEALPLDKIYCILGNDDDLYLDNIIDSSCGLVYCNGRAVITEYDLQIIGYSASALTPWNTPREEDDERISNGLRNIQLNSNIPVLANIHCPPLGIGLDSVAKLDSNFRPIMKNGGFEMTYAGSLAVNKFISDYQPMLGLFGHVHEGRGMGMIDKTVCINPGSAFSDGRLLGTLVFMKNNKVVDWQLTEG